MKTQQCPPPEAGTVASITDPVRVFWRVLELLWGQVYYDALVRRVNPLVGVLGILVNWNGVHQLLGRGWLVKLGGSRRCYARLAPEVPEGKHPLTLCTC